MTRLPLATLLLIVVACARGAGDEGETEAVHATVAASVTPATTQPFLETVDAIGVVSPRAGNVASLSASTATRVSRVLVAPGALVKAGDPLVEFDQAPFEVASKSADAALAAAASEAERTRKLADAGVLSRKEAEAAAAALAAANLDVQNARRALRLATLRSPINGVVTRMSATIGADVDMGQQLVDVTDVSELDVVFTPSIADAARIRAGQDVLLYEDAKALGNPVGNARVVDVMPAVDSNSLGVPVRAAISRGPRAARIGETLFGRITIADHPLAIVIPDEALVPEGEGYVVFVIDSSGIAHSSPVLVGGPSDKNALIAQGLAAGERVVTHGAYGVSDSSRVVKDSGGGL
jgi:membrane fusion protein (multidrug efflux system)